MGLPPPPGHRERDVRAHVAAADDRRVRARFFHLKKYTLGFARRRRHDYMRIAKRLIAAALAAWAPALVMAQAYPAKPVTVIVPYPPGGATDIIGRVLAQKLS